MSSGEFTFCPFFHGGSGIRQQWGRPVICANGQKVPRKNEGELRIFTHSPPFPPSFSYFFSACTTTFPHLPPFQPISPHSSFLPPRFAPVSHRFPCFSGLRGKSVLVVAGSLQARAPGNSGAWTRGQGKAPRRCPGEVRVTPQAPVQVWQARHVGVNEGGIRVEGWWEPHHGLLEFYADVCVGWGGVGGG